MSHITAESTDQQVRAWALQLVRLSHSNPDSLPWVSHTGSDHARYEQALTRCENLRTQLQQLQKA